MSHAVVLQEDEARTEEEENYAVLNTAFNFTARAASVELTYICQYISYVGMLLQKIFHLKLQCICLTTSDSSFGRLITDY